MEPANKRITGFDSLRFFMVFLVIALHSAMTYMEYAPSWWYVLEENRSIWFAFLVVYLDSFPMTALFFLAGYFAFPSINKRGKYLFIKDKLLRIGVPWALGVVLVAPFTAHATAVALGFPPPDIYTFMTSYFLGPFYQQGHYWFLGVLFFFLTAFALVARVGTAVKPKPLSNPRSLIAGLLFVSVLTYYLSGRYVMPAVDWINIGYILYFQPARFAGYVGIFALGCYAWQTGWFTESGWSPPLFLWGTISAISGMLLVIFKFFLAPERGELFDLVSETLAYNITAVSTTLFLLALFLKIQRPLHNLTRQFDRDSFGIYWLHMIVLMPLLFLLKSLAIPIGLKWVLSLPVTVVVCTVILRLSDRCVRILGRNADK